MSWNTARFPESLSGLNMNTTVIPPRRSSTVDSDIEIRFARPDDIGPIAELMYSTGTDFS